MALRLLTLGTMLAASLLVVACSDPVDDNATPAPTQDVPDSALASPAAYTSFAGSLAQDDSAEPLSLDRVGMAPTSETDDPVSLN